ncbi:MAG: zinc-binding alcohol dehydrogenase family protein [Pseudomonadota bacterium]
MKAVAYTQSLPVTDERSLMDVELPDPCPSGHDLLVRVQAVSVNPRDYKQRTSLTGISATLRVLGWDAAGIVEAVGPAVSLFRPGDKVYYAGAANRPGCNSELHLVDERIAGPMPASLSYEQAAALPLTFVTAWEALFDRLRIPLNNTSNKPATLLVIGGAGGVGSAAIQLAAKVAGLNIIATASRPASAKWCEQLGAHHVVNHFDDLVKAVRATGLRYVDYVLVLNGLDRHFAAASELIVPQGSICSIVSAEGPLDMDVLRRKSGSLCWELMFTRSSYETPDMVQQHHCLAQVAKLIDAGVIETTVNELLTPINAANLRKAHGMLEEGRAIGKIVLRGFA